MGLELRQNTLALRSAAYQEISRDVQRVTSTIPNVARGKRRRGEQLTYVENAEYLQWFNATMRAYESWWQQHQLGVIDETTFNSYIGHMRLSLDEQSLRDYWERGRNWSATPGFEEYVAAFLAENPINGARDSSVQ